MSKLYLYLTDRVSARLFSTFPYIIPPLFHSGGGTFSELPIL